MQHQQPEQHQQNTAGTAHQLSPTLLTVSLSQTAAVLLSSDQETSPGLHCSLSAHMRLPLRLVLKCNLYILEHVSQLKPSKNLF